MVEVSNITYTADGITIEYGVRGGNYILRLDPNVTVILAQPGDLDIEALRTLLKGRLHTIPADRLHEHIGKWGILEHEATQTTGSLTRDLCWHSPSCDWVCST